MNYSIAQQICRELDEADKGLIRRASALVAIHAAEKKKANKGFKNNPTGWSGRKKKGK